MLLKYKPWERLNGNGNGNGDKKALAGYLVDIAKYAGKIGDLSRDIHELHIFIFGIDGQGGFAKEIDRLRTWREHIELDIQKMESRLSRLEGK